VRERVSALTSLAEDLILLARTQEGSRAVTLREVDVAALVDDAFRRQQGAAAARGITLRQDGLSGVRVYADPALMARVVDNVIANAVHYNREHGHVMVTASVEEPAAGTWAPPIVEIVVQDTGAGIPPAEQERVFERFYRVDQSRARNTGGSGLGLAICREVLSLHGGTIRVRDSARDGTTLEIRLPGRGAEPAVEAEGRDARHPVESPVAP
jgi:two-component system sensor histidine kinase SenX3